MHVKRLVLPALAFLMGAYTSISYFVDEWKERQCWMGDTCMPVESPFFKALGDAWNDLLSQGSVSFIFRFLILTAFLWIIATSLIANKRAILILAICLCAFPFSVTIYSQMYFGQDYVATIFGFGVLGLQFLALIIGVIALIMALISRITKTKQSSVI